MQPLSYPFHGGGEGGRGGGGSKAKDKDKAKTFDWRKKEENTGNYPQCDIFGQAAICQLT